MKVIWIHFCYVYFVFLRDRRLETTRSIRSWVPEQPLAAQPNRARSREVGAREPPCQGLSSKTGLGVCLLMLTTKEATTAVSVWQVCGLSVFSVRYKCLNMPVCVARLCHCFISVYTRETVGRKNPGLASAPQWLCLMLP